MSTRESGKTSRVKLSSRARFPIEGFHFTWVALVAMTWIVFFQVWQFEFVQYDDEMYVFGNPHVMGGLTAENVQWAFSWPSTLVGIWHPLTWLSLMLDSEIHGDFAGGFHLTNVLFHTMNVLFLFALLRKITGAWWESAFVAALFAVHPLHVESVAWVAERKDVLSTFFGLLSLSAYARYASRPSAFWFLVTLLTFVLSMLSKPMLVTLPCLILLLDYWPLRRFRNLSPTESDRSDVYSERGKVELPCPQQSWRRLVLEKIPFFVITAVFCVVAVKAQQFAGAMVSLTEFSLADRIGNSIASYVRYIAQTVWPRNLACFYPIPEALSPLELAGAVAFLTIVSIVAVTQAKRRPFLLVGWLWYLGTLVPVIGLLQTGWQGMADRYTYIPSIGLFVAFAWLVPSLLPSGSHWKKLLPVIAAIILVTFTTISRVQTGYWRDSFTLVEHTLAVTENNQPSNTHMAFLLYTQGKYDEAFKHFEEALRIDPTDVTTRNNLGAMLIKQGQIDRGIFHLRQAIRFDAKNVVTRNNLGQILLNQNQFAEATLVLQQALIIDPNNAQTHFNLSKALNGQGLIEESLQHRRKAQQLNRRLRKSQKD